MLKLSQTRLDPAEYAKIAAVLPRADEYMALAGRLGAYQGAVPKPWPRAGVRSRPSPALNFPEPDQSTVSRRERLGLSAESIENPRSDGSIRSLAAIAPRAAIAS